MEWIQATSRPCYHHRFPIRLVRRPSPSGAPTSLEQTSQPRTTLMNWRCLIQRLRKTDLRELRGTVNRFAPKPIDARHGRNHQDGALLLLKHDRNRVTGEQKRGAHVGVHHVVV